jgi:hypothetical protein
VLGLDEEVEPVPQAHARWPLLVGDRLEWFRDACEPALGDGVTQRGLASEVAVDAAVADAESAGDVDDVRLGRPVVAEDLLRRFEDPLGCECLRRHAMRP